jgi:hypothetical protein
MVRGITRMVGNVHGRADRHTSVLCLRRLAD